MAKAAQFWGRLRGLITKERAVESIAYLVFVKYFIRIHRANRSRIGARQMLKSPLAENPILR